MPRKVDSQHDRVSPTALFIASFRPYTDIRYSAEIVREAKTLNRENGGVEEPESQVPPEMVLPVEARYVLADRILAEHRITQIFEIASGLSPRGLIMTDGRVESYVEVDLPKLIEAKREIVKRIKGTIPDHLHLEPADATSMSDLEAAARHFNPKKPIAVVNEGLLNYLDFDEKTTVAENVRRLLERFGGVWVTPDVNTKVQMEMRTAVRKEASAHVTKITGSNRYNKAFADVGEALRFFGQLGFDVQVRNFMEVRDQLTSVRKLGIADKEIEALIGDSLVFAMRLKS